MEQILLDTCQSGDTRQLHELLQKQKVKEGEVYMKALHLCCQIGATEKVAYLLEKDIDVHKADASGWTAMDYACKHGHETITSQLIKAGVNVNSENILGLTPLMLASLFGHVTCVETFLLQGADISHSSHSDLSRLHIASINNDYEWAQITNYNKADTEIKDKHGRTPLHYACFYGHNKVVEQLYGALSTVFDNYGLTPLMYAAANAHRCCIEELIKCEADITLTTTDGIQAMCFAHHFKHSSVVSLIENSVDGNAVCQCYKGVVEHDSQQLRLGNIGNLERWFKEKHKEFIFPVNGSQAVHMAARGGQVDVIKVFAKHKLDTQAVDSEDWTALHESTFLSHPAVTKTLIQSSFEVNKGTNINLTPVACASYSGDLESLKALLKKDALLEESALGGSHPLHLAAWRGHSDIVRCLLSHGADVSCKCQFGCQPLTEASEKGRKRMSTNITGSWS